MEELFGKGYFIIMKEKVIVNIKENIGKFFEDIFYVRVLFINLKFF